MIVSFRPKGLEELYNKGKTRKIDQKFWPKLKIVFETLTRLESEEAIMAHPAWDTHKLHGITRKDSLFQNTGRLRFPVTGG